jgi:hypothetical protein
MRIRAICGWNLIVEPTGRLRVSAWWRWMIERWFRDWTQRRLKRGVFHSAIELERAILKYVEHRDANPQPFVWTKSASPNPQLSHPRQESPEFLTNSAGHYTWGTAGPASRQRADCRF